MKRIPEAYREWMYLFMPDSERADAPSKALVYRWGN